jgi:hypothetical protein
MRQRVDTNTPQIIEMCGCVAVSKHRHLNSSTHQHINTVINTSHQHINTSTRQYHQLNIYSQCINTSTRQTHKHNHRRVWMCSGIDVLMCWWLYWIVLCVDVSVDVDVLMALFHVDVLMLMPWRVDVAMIVRTCWSVDVLMFMTVDVSICVGHCVSELMCWWLCW